jgi:hypothetical protein
MHCEAFGEGPTPGVKPTWGLVYATIDAPYEKALHTLTTRHQGIPIFGCTSFRGVFSPKGFSRGVHLLFGEADDEIVSAPVLRATGASKARVDARAAALEIASSLGRAPDTVLLHATPGFEERILEGIDDATGGQIPVYGGSAADDAIQGDWRIFLGTRVVREGFLLVGFASSRRVHGSFVSGYPATARKGIVTSAHGRTIQTIDGERAATVYNQWTNGVIGAHLGGGNVLSATTLHPIGRVVDRVGSVPRYVLSHPHEVTSDGGLSFFAEFTTGDQITLMLGSEGALIDRTDQVATRALGGGQAVVRGAVLIYCGGCVLAIGDAAAKVGTTFSERIGKAPFIGAATFGEQGSYPGTINANRHGNLMCDAILFDR